MAEASGWRSNRVDQVWNLGDLVGYGASPNEVVEFIAGSQCPVVSVRGNHDDAAITEEVENFNAYAAEAALWTSRALSRQNKEFVRSLPVKQEVEIDGWPVFMVHGSPDDPLNEYVHPLVPAARLNTYLSKAQSRVLLMGHTHIPMKFELQKGMVVNPGSVGQSRDGFPSASYALLQMSRSGVVAGIHRQDYMIKVPAEKILEAGLPPILAHRLFEGW